MLRDLQSWLFEPNLLEPNRKPIGPVEIDPDSGIKRAFLHEHTMFDVGGIVPTSGSPDDYAMTAEGYGASFSGSSAIVAYADNFYPTDGDMAVLSLIRVDDLSATQCWLYESDGTGTSYNGFGIAVDMREIHLGIGADGVVYFTYQNGSKTGSANAASVNTVSVGDIVVVGGRRKGNVSSVWLDGVNENEITVAMTASPNAATVRRYNECGDPTAGRDFKSTVIASIIFHHAPTDAEMLAYSQDLYRGLRPVDPWVPMVKTGGSITAVGLVSETNTAFSIGILKTRSIGLSSETDNAMAVGSSKAMSIGLGSEINTALAINSLKSWSINLATETDSAQAMSYYKTVALGVAQETNSALPIDTLKAMAIGLATETDTAFGIALPSVFRPGMPGWDIAAQDYTWDIHDAGHEWVVPEQPTTWEVH